MGRPFFLFVERLLGIINLNCSCSAEAASLAFNILPGLVGAIFLSRKMPIPDFLNSFLRDPLFADDPAILASARSFAHVLITTRARSASYSRRPAPAETKLIRRTERLLRERRTGAAMQSAEQLLDLIDRDLIAEAGLAPLTSSYSPIHRVLLLPKKSHLPLATYSPLSSSPLSPSLPAMCWKSSSIYPLGLLPVLLDGPMPP